MGNALTTSFGDKTHHNPEYMYTWFHRPDGNIVYSANILHISYQ